MAGASVRSVEVLDSTMSYRETGDGPPVLLLHGNPTSSHLWRHVLSRAGQGHRWIAPDLIGMGCSGRPGIQYRLADHVRYLDAFLDELGLRELVLVGHDWGVALALDLHRRRDDIRGIAFMEGHIRPLESWHRFDQGGRRLFQQLRTPGAGEELALQENFFIETLLPGALNRTLSGEEMAPYRRPYADATSRIPLLQWAREIPVAGQPGDVAARMAAAARHLATSLVPKLLVHGEPGVLVTSRVTGWCREVLPALTVVNVGGPAGHFLPEDRPVEVARALTTWVKALPSPMPL